MINTQPSSKFNSLAEYAAYQGAPLEAFTRLGFGTETVRVYGRPAIAIRWQGGEQYRFIDGQAPKYVFKQGSRHAWFGLASALAIAAETGYPLVIVNGASGVAVAQYHGIPAVAIPGGEGAKAPFERLLPELLAAYPGRVIIAHDCDLAGRTGAAWKARRLLDAGRDAIAVDLLLGEKGDIADFCKLHGAVSTTSLLALPVIPPTEPESIFHLRETDAPVTAGQIDWLAENDYWWANEVIPAIYRTTTATKGHGDKVRFRCVNPVHPDNDPSARISHDVDKSGIYICTCGSHSRETVAGWLGLNFKAWFKDNRQHLYPRPKRSVQAREHKATATPPAQAEQGSNWHPDLPVITLEKPAPHITVNTRYLSNASISVVSDPANRSPLGSGKTQWVIEEINRIKPKRVLFITYLQALTENAAARLNAGVKGQPFEHYLGVPNEYPLGSIDRLVCSLNSLYRLQAAAAYDLIVIDEIEQVIPALWGGTLKGKESTRAYSVLVDTLKRAAQVIVLDAHLSRESIEFLQSAGRAPTVIENTFKPERPPLTVHQYKSSLIEAALQCADSNPTLPIVITTTSRTLARVADRLCKERYGAEQVMTIHGWNSTEQTAQTFLKAINQELPQYRVLIASPSVGTGIDVTCDVAGVFGYFPGNHLPPTAMMQQLLRYRNARHYAAHVPHIEGSKPTQADELLSAERYKIRQTRSYIGRNDDVTLPQAELTRLWAKYTAHHNRMSNQPLATFAELATAEGFTLQWVGGNNQGSAEQLVEATKALRTADDNLILTLPALSRMDFDCKRLAGKLVENDHLALQRWKIEDTTGQEITSDLLERYHGKGNLAALVRLTTYIHGGGAEATRTDRLDLENLPFKRRHSAVQNAFFDGLIKTVFGRKGLKFTGEIPADELSDRAAPYLKAHRETVFALDGIAHKRTRRDDLSDGPIPEFRRMLKRWHVSLKSRQVMRGGKRFLVYWIDHTSLGVYLADAAYRWAKIQQEVITRNAEEDSYIRDSSNRSVQQQTMSSVQSPPSETTAPYMRKHYTNPFSMGGHTHV